MSSTNAVLQKISNAIVFAFCAFLIVILSCENGNKKRDNTSQADVVATIKDLNTSEKRTQFLAQLFEDDQKVRDSDTSLAILKRNNYDMKSDEYNLYVKNQQKVDSFNFLKVLHYIKEFGYPKINELNPRASYGILTVALHQQYNKRVLLFSYLFTAYREGDIPEDQFANFVWDMYQLKFHENYKNLKDDQESINDMLTKMNLINL